MAKFLVESSHTARECVWALRQVLRQGSENLEQYDWGCRDGVHVGWAIVKANTKFDVQSTIPEMLRAQTRIIRLNRFRPEEIMAFHEGELSALAERAGAR
jgi:hypothetical protein